MQATFWLWLITLALVDLRVVILHSNNKWTYFTLSLLWQFSLSVVKCTQTQNVLPDWNMLPNGKRYEHFLGTRYTSILFEFEFNGRPIADALNRLYSPILVVGSKGEIFSRFSHYFLPIADWPTKKSTIFKILKKVF